MRETEAGWKVEELALAESPSRKFHRLEEQQGCVELEQSGVEAGAGLEHSLSGEGGRPRCDEQERAESGHPTGWAAGCS